MNERADERARCRRVTDGQLPARGDDPGHHVVGDRAMHDQPAQAGAALTGGAGGGEHHGAHRQVEVGRRRHDRRVVAAQLQQRSPEAPGHARADLLAHPHRTGRRQQRDPGVVDQLLAQVTVAQHQTAHRGRRTDVGGGPADQRLAGQRGQRRQLRGLPHHGVPAHQRHRGVPCPHRDREVERGDHTDHTEWMPCLQQPVPGAFRRDGPAVELARQTHGELADVDHFLHFAQRLRGDLAYLEGHQCREVVLVSVSSSPSRATNAPRTGAGVLRHAENARAAPAMV